MTTAKWLLSGALAIVGSLAVGDALACGAPFSPDGGVRFDPSQDVILVHKAGVETYVFQPRFCGIAQDFGLILPVPARLSSAPRLVDPLVFGRLDLVTRPKDVYVDRCIERNTGGFGADAGGGGYDNAQDSGPTIVASGRVGFLDWVQLEATDRASFTAWLDANGYPYDSRAQDAFDYYVGQHWYFLAFKISPGADLGYCAALGPIAVTFPTSMPVIPSRMASAAVRPTQAVPDSGVAPPYLWRWRVFGITDSGFELAASSTRSFSGAIGADLVPELDGLAKAGDRLTKHQLSFYDAATDVALWRASASDYQEVNEHVRWVECGPDGAASGGGSAYGCSAARVEARAGLWFGVGLAGVVGVAAGARRALGRRRRER